MCDILVIVKNNTDSTKEFKVKLKEADQLSFDTPYYVIVEYAEQNIQFEYSYSENSIRTDEVNLSGMKILYGEKTGRIFKIIADCQSVKNINNLKAEINERLSSFNNWTDLKLSNFKFGANVFLAILQDSQFGLNE